ncbi:MAG TPA: RNA 2',3'-cyclic phosphodiesterase [Blastocatellia bacterium]|nr:RNA 2',3'-cyclic phosphodiesterase [Blastocatellia bacterium]
MSRQNETGELPGRGRKDSIRAFICIEVPGAIKERIESLQRALKKNDAQISWVKPSNIHLTIKFLGDIPAPSVETVRGAVGRASRSIGEFEIEIGGAGCFPSPRSPRVLWVGLSGLPEALKRLHSNIENELDREGFARERKRFSPHLTIGRVRSPHNAARTAEDLIATGFEPEAFRATEVIVMRSDLNSAGSVYTPQATIKLSDGD